MVGDRSKKWLPSKSRGAIFLVIESGSGGRRSGGGSGLTTVPVAMVELVLADLAAQGIAVDAQHFGS